MDRERLLTLASFGTALLLSIHLAEDVVRGFEPGGTLNIVGIILLVVWLAGVFLLNGRLAGYIIMLIGGLLGFAVPLMHMQGAGMVGGRITGSSGVLFWVWTMLAAGALGLFSAIVAALAIWNRRKDSN